MNYIEQFMKDNDIKIDEEFYITDGNNILEGLYDSIFFFNEKFQLKEKVDDSLCDNYILLRGLMSGEYKIEKIQQKPKTVWDLKDGDEHYYINCLGKIVRTHYYGCTDDVELIEMGNAFLTEEEAKFEVERRKCEAILLKYGTMDMMSFGDSKKYFIYYSNYYNEISVSYYMTLQSQGTIYFESEELARKAIEEVGEDRLKKYVFNVKVPDFLNKKMNVKE